jgi:transcriptional regulator with XRE-family HTH domain
MDYIESNIKRLAKKKHITIEDLSKKVGFSKNGFQKQIRNKSYKLDTLVKLARELDSSLYELIMDSDLTNNNSLLNLYSNILKPLNEKDYISIRLDKIILCEYDIFFFLSNEIKSFISLISSRSSMISINPIIIPDDKFYNLMKLSGEEWIDCASAYFQLFYEQKTKANKDLIKELEEYIKNFIIEFRNHCLSLPIIVNMIKSNIYEENIVILEICKTLQLKLFGKLKTEYISVLIKTE